VVDVRRSRLEPAVVEVVVVLQAARDAFTHRRIRCLASDLDAGPLFVSSSKTAAEGGAPSQPRWVRDEDFDTFDAAVLSAETVRPQANPREWQTPDAFEKRIGSFRFLRRLQPLAADPSRVQALAAIVAYWICVVLAGLAAAVVAKMILEWAPWETVEGAAVLVDAALIIVPLVIVVAHLLGLTADECLRDLFSRHNLDVAINGTEARSLAEEVRDGVRDGVHAARRWIVRNRPGRQLEPGRHEAPRRLRRPLLRRRPTRPGQ
jgi:hypothetical protein